MEIKSMNISCIRFFAVLLSLLTTLLIHPESSLAKRSARKPLKGLNGDWVLGFVEGRKSKSSIAGDADLSRFRGGFTIYSIVQAGDEVNIFDQWGNPGPQGEVTKDSLRFPPSYPIEGQCLLNSKILAKGNLIVFQAPCQSYNNGYPVMIRVGSSSCPKKPDYQDLIASCRIPSDSDQSRE
jgi:hypothetical protein